MNWKIEHLRKQDFFRVLVSGSFEAEEFRPLFDHIFTDDFWRPGKPILFDNRLMNLKGVDYESLSRVKNYFQKDNLRFGESRIALLYKSLADFGVGRQFQTITEDNVLARFGVFTDETAAIAWLLS